MLSAIRRYIPHLLVGFSISLVMVGAYAAVGFSASSQPKVSWAVNPVMITFPVTADTGTQEDSFTCGLRATGITLVAKVGTPRMSLTVSPSGFPFCYSTPTAITLTASCLVSAPRCLGTYEGLVQIRQPANYRDLPSNLVVRIVVT